jgi:UDP-glucose 4-epimerase
VDALIDRKYSVTVIDDLSSGHIENLVGARNQGVNFIRESILDREAVNNALAGAHAVFHLAAIPSVPRSIDDPIRTHTANSTGTLMVLEACRNQHVSKVVYAASTSAQGDLGDAPRTEAIHGLPTSPYAVSKYAGELYGYVYHLIHRVRFLSLRLFNVYGPRQRPDCPYSSVIPTVLFRGLKDRPVTIFGDGRQTRDFTYVGDVVRAFLLALNDDHAVDSVINVCSGCCVSIRRLIEAAERVLGKQLEIQYAPPRAGDILHVKSDPSLAKRLLRFEAATSLDQGLRQTSEWLREYLVR